MKQQKFHTCGRPFWTLPSRHPREGVGGMIIIITNLDGEEWESWLKQNTKGKERQWWGGGVGGDYACQGPALGQAFEINDHTKLTLALSGGAFYPFTNVKVVTIMDNGARI